MRRNRIQVCLAVVGAVLGFAACGGQADVAEGEQEGALIGTTEEALGPSLVGEIERGCKTVCNKACPPKESQRTDPPDTLPNTDKRECASGCVASTLDLCLPEYRDFVKCLAKQPASDLACFDGQFPFLETSSCDAQSNAYLDCLFGSF